MPDNEGIIMYPDPPAHNPAMQPAPDEENELQTEAQEADEER